MFIIEFFVGAFTVTVNREGNCELLTQTILDREKIDVYTLNISVSSISTVSSINFNTGDRGTVIILLDVILANADTDFAEAMIFVIDVNDNAPQFQFETDYLGYKMYFGALDMNAREFSSILTVKVYHFNFKFVLLRFQTNQLV